MSADEFADAVADRVVARLLEHLAGPPLEALAQGLVDRGMTSTAAAERLRVSPNTLRSWERRWGVPAPARTTGGHRRYDPREVEALRDALEGAGTAKHALALLAGGR